VQLTVSTVRFAPGSSPLALIAASSSNLLFGANMSFRFIDHTNRYIDKLVEISWRESGSHVNEVVFTRTSEEDDATKVINDKLDSSEKYESNTTLNLSQEGRTQPFEEGQAVHGNKIVIAVDTGLVHLGEFIGGGIAFAIRGAAVCLIGGQP
jgi:hypothetical protein